MRIIVECTAINTDGENSPFLTTPRKLFTKVFSGEIAAIGYIAELLFKEKVEELDKDEMTKNACHSVCFDHHISEEPLSPSDIVVLSDNGTEYAHRVHLKAKEVFTSWFNEFQKMRNGSPRPLAEEALQSLKEIDHNDPEAGHAEADEILCDFLVSFGYEEIVREYKKIDKWYA